MICIKEVPTQRSTKTIVVLGHGDEDCSKYRSECLLFDTQRTVEGAYVPILINPSDPSDVVLESKWERLGWGVLFAGVGGTIVLVWTFG